ncbi:MAG: hypothetical protein PHD03_02770 [Bacilli bacterium]|nr:hypothetical protein [Bacilli bacterium]MDD4407049.1 hypothetical protein [Bacilli bacterium]
MKFLISINNKMFEKYTPRKLIKTIVSLDKNNSIDGAEIYIDIINDIEKDYALELVRFMKNILKKVIK